jgi:hypothetical protein
MFRLAFENEFGQVGHALRIEDAVEMVTFVLNDAGVETLGHALDRLAVDP